MSWHKKRLLKVNEVRDLRCHKVFWLFFSMIFSGSVQYIDRSTQLLVRSSTWPKSMCWQKVLFKIESVAIIFVMFYQTFACRPIFCRNVVIDFGMLAHLYGMT